MNLRKVLGAGTFGTVATVLLASDFWMVYDACRECPLPEAMQEFDQNQNKTLDPGRECMEAIAKLVDGNRNGVLTQSEIDTNGRQVTGELYRAGGKNNKISAKAISDEMGRIRLGQVRLSDWQAAVTRAKHLKTTRIRRCVGEDYPFTGDQIKEGLQRNGVDVVSVEKFISQGGFPYEFEITYNYPERMKVNDSGLEITKAIVAWEHAEKMKKEKDK